MPGMPGFGPWLYQATSVKFVGIPMVPSPLHESPTLCILASTPIAGMTSRAAAAGCAKEVPIPCGAVEVETVSCITGSCIYVCAVILLVCINIERPATSRPTPMDSRTAFFIYLPYPPPVLGKPGVTGGAGGTYTPASTFTAQVLLTPPLVTVSVLRPALA